MKKVTKQKLLKRNKAYIEKLSKKPIIILESVKVGLNLKNKESQNHK